MNESQLKEDQEQGPKPAPTLNQGETSYLRKTILSILEKGAAIGLIAGLLVFIIQYHSRSLFAQVEAVSQVITLTVSKGEPLSWALPANAQLVNCGNFKSVQFRPEKIGEATLFLREGSAIQVERMKKDIYLRFPGSKLKEGAGTKATDPLRSGATLGRTERTNREIVSTQQCIKITKLGEDERLIWEMRGEIVIGDDYSGNVAEQRLLLEGIVNMYQAEGLPNSNSVDGQLLLQTRKLNFGEKILFTRQIANATVPSEMRGILRIGGDSKALDLTAFGKVSSTVIMRTPYAGESAIFEMKSGFSSVLFALIKDGAQSYWFLIMAALWYVVSKRYFE
jgi:hypothetical protein